MTDIFKQTKTKRGLYRTKLYRYLQSAERPGRKLRYSFMDEYGKITNAKYILKEVINSNVKDILNFVWRLDARSIRYMRRVRIIENKRQFKRIPPI